MIIIKGTLKILGPKGHKELAWEKLSDETRAEAEKAFTTAEEQGHIGYLMDGNKIGHKVDKLPESGDVVMAPRLVGG